MIIFYYILLYSIIFYYILWNSIIVYYYFTFFLLYHTILYFIILNIIWYDRILYHTILNHVILYYIKRIILYYIILYYTILYYIILYYIILIFTKLYYLDIDITSFILPYICTDGYTTVWTLCFCSSPWSLTAETLGRAPAIQSDCPIVGGRRCLECWVEFKFTKNKKNYILESTLPLSG